MTYSIDGVGWPFSQAIQSCGKHKMCEAAAGGTLLFHSEFFFKVERTRSKIMIKSVVK